LMKNRISKLILVLMIVSVICFALSIAVCAAEEEVETTPTIISEEAQGSSYSWTLDSKGTLTFTKIESDTLDVSNSNTVFNEWRKKTTEGQTETNEDLVKAIVVGEGIGTIRNQHWKTPVLGGYKNLVSIHLVSATRFTNQAMTMGFFEGNEKLTTLTHALSENNATGVINLDKVPRFDSYAPDAKKRMFKDCGAITEIIFSETKATETDAIFENSMFSGCDSLTTITIPSWVESIEADAFKDCIALTSITIPSSVTSIAAGAFSGCNALTSVTIEGKAIIEDSTAFPDKTDLSICCLNAKTGDALNAFGYASTQIVGKIFIGEQIGGDYHYSWSLDTSTGILTFTPGTDAKNNTILRADSNTTALKTWKATYSSYVYHIVLEEGFTEITTNNSAGPAPLHNFANLETIKLPGTLTKFESKYDFKGVFSLNPNLTTIYKGELTENKMGTVDLSTINSMGGNSYGIGRMFLGDSSIKKVILPSTNSGNNKYIGAYMFSGCTALEEVNIPVWAASIKENAFDGCSSLTRLTIENPDLDLSLYSSYIPDNEGMIIYCTSQEQYDYVAENFTNATPKGIQICGEEAGYYSWSLDTLTKVLEFTPIGTVTELRTSKDLTAFNTWKNTYGDMVEHIVFDDGFEIVCGANAVCATARYNNLISIDLGNITTIQSNWNDCGMFQDNLALTTIYSNNAEKKTGVADISFIKTVYGSSANSGFHQWFQGCTALTNVILPEKMPQTHNSAPVNYIVTSAFNGCIALESIIIPDYIVTINANAFAGCTALRQITLMSGNTVLADASSLPDSAILTVLCGSASQAETIKSYYSNTKTATYNSLISHGFSIRYNEYNGLRAIYGFDTEHNAAIETDFKLTLVEYGVMVSTKSEYEYWGVGLTNVNGNYVTANSSIKKIAVTETKKYLSDQDQNSNTLDFACAVTKYTNNYTTDIHFCAYSIHVDEAGNEYIAYTYCDEDTKFMNLYDFTLKFYKENLFNILSNKKVDEIAVWNTLMQGAHEKVSELAVDGYDATVTLVADGDSYIAFVKGNVAGTAPSADAIDAANAMVADYSPAMTIALGVNSSETIPANTVTFDYSSLAATVASKKYDRSTEMAQHCQGMCVDDKNEYMYYSLTGVVVKVRISDGEEVGKFTVSSEHNTGNSFHMGDLAYHNGYLYGSVTYWGSDKTYIGVIDCSKLEGNVSETNAAGEQVIYGLYCPQFSETLSNGNDAFRLSGLDGITVGTLPGKGYVKADGTEVTDTEKYLLVARTNGEFGEEYYDNDNKVIFVFDFDDITKENLLPLNGARVAQETEDKVINCKQRLFVYTGFNSYGIQNLSFDKATGDIWLSCYGRGAASEFPLSSGKVTYVVDGSKKLYLDEIEVGQSISADSENYETARAVAALYLDTADLNEDGNTAEQMLGWHMTLKCICGNGDIDCHEAESYGDNGHAAKICCADLTSAMGFDSLGNGYFYWGEMSTGTKTHENGNTETTNGGKSYLKRLSSNVGAWKFLNP
ncbi:MAG: leucine-rich repeat protein, partial [Clostridia bacterium]|nr:leucine-rich repeat protein [Clostridia bacterium]